MAIGLFVQIFANTVSEITPSKCFTYYWAIKCDVRADWIIINLSCSKWRMVFDMLELYWNVECFAIPYPDSREPHWESFFHIKKNICWCFLLSYLSHQISMQILWPTLTFEYLKLAHFRKSIAIVGSGTAFLLAFLLLLLYFLRCLCVDFCINRYSFLSLKIFHWPTHARATYFVYFLAMRYESDHGEAWEKQKKKTKKFVLRNSFTTCKDTLNKCPSLSPVFLNLILFCLNFGRWFRLSYTVWSVTSEGDKAAWAA